MADRYLPPDPPQYFPSLARYGCGRPMRVGEVHGPEPRPREANGFLVDGMKVTAVRAKNMRWMEGVGSKFLELRRGNLDVRHG